MDLYALGVILFAMRAGHQPFENMAHEDDSLYKFFYPEHRLDQFWKCVEQHQEKNHYSVQFKDIIGTMLDYYPSRRLMMADLIAHPWMQGEFPTE